MAAVNPVVPQPLVAVAGSGRLADEVTAELLKKELAEFFADKDEATVARALWARVQLAMTHLSKLTIPQEVLSPVKKLLITEIVRLPSLVRSSAL